MYRLFSTLFVVLCIFSPLNSQAATFDFNFSATSSLFTANDGSQTEWLHLSENDHLNFSQSSAALSTNPDWAGYEIATMAMVGQLTEELFGFNWATLPTGSSDLYDEYCLDAVSFFGDTYTSSTYPNYVWGHVADIYNNDPNQRYTMMLTNNNFTGHRTDGYLYRYVKTITDVNPQRGTFLVREVATVPIPGAVILLGSGLLSLVAIQRKRK